MSQIIVEQQFHYTAKMNRNKHFPNTIDTNRDAKLETFFSSGWRQSSLRSQNFRGGKNSAPVRWQLWRLMS